MGLADIRSLRDDLRGGVAVDRPMELVLHRSEEFLAQGSAGVVIDTLVA